MDAVVRPLRRQGMDPHGRGSHQLGQHGGEMVRGLQEACRDKPLAQALPQLRREGSVVASLEGLTSRTRTNTYCEATWIRGR